MDVLPLEPTIVLPVLTDILTTVEHANHLVEVLTQLFVLVENIEMLI